ncbi:YdeI/OmpD-associated family protein [Salipiger sp.]|uniref:YdeI/OmpD-associated family protein n=1 Tax=Salipiger sp. TaxID=2078585 RepID=UPI003A96D81F
MSDTQARIEAFYAAGRRWAPELALLREILNASPLEETFKWRSPCYTFEDANLAMPFGLKDNCGLSFFRGVLLDDPRGLLEPPGDNSRSARVMRFTSVEGIAAHRGDLDAFLRRTVELEQAGVRVDLPPDDFDLPDELTEALAGDDELRTAWEALTPGRRRGWVLQFTQPKQSATKVARIERARDKILDGKGIHDR